MPRIALSPVVAVGLLALLARAQDAGKPTVAILNPHGGIAAPLSKALDRHGIALDVVADDVLTASDSPLIRANVVLLQHVRAEHHATLVDALAAGLAVNPAMRIVPMTTAATNMAKSPRIADAVTTDPEIVVYYTGSTIENLERLADYLATTYFERSVAIRPPVARPPPGLWHPDADPPLDDPPSFDAFLEKRGTSRKAAPVAVVTVHSTHLEFQQPEIVRALVAAMERRGIITVAAIDSAEGMGSQRARYEANLRELAPDIVIHTCHSPDTLEFRKVLDVPHLSAIFLGRDGIDTWRSGVQGLDGGTMAFQIATQEVIGAIEPIVSGGAVHGRASGEALVPIPDRIEHLADRAVRWIELRRKQNAEKAVAVLYYDRELDPAALMRGSTTGMHMNAPRSLVKILERLAAEGYRVDPLPRDDDELIAWMQARGRQIGLWDEATFDRLVREGDPVLIPLEEYRAWYEATIEETYRKRLEERWGPPPGRFMAVTDAKGKSSIVIPRIDLGGVVLLPQPLRGEAHELKLLHDKDAPPPHNYLATYYWLEKKRRVDAMVHFGTHGSEFFFPGKRSGLSKDDWCDVLLGTTPNITPWIVDNLGELLPVKRRMNAVIVSHQTPPIVTIGLSDELENLHRDVEKYLGLESGTLKDSFHSRLRESVRALHLDRDLGWSDVVMDRLDDDAVRLLDDHLHELKESQTPTRLHIFGEAPEASEVAPYVTACLKQRYLDLLAPLLAKSSVAPGHHAHETVEKAAIDVVDQMLRGRLAPADALRAAGVAVDVAVPEELDRLLRSGADLAARLGRASEEIDGLLRALSGRFVEPGSGASPARNPSSAPGGRNLYVVNPDEIPSRASFDLGKRLGDELALNWKNAHGKWPERIAFDMSAHATFQDYGVMEAQILRLIGCEPIWDEKNVVMDVRVLPIEELGRPRIDVFLSTLGFYRDNLPSRMKLLDLAIRKVATLDEKDNFVAASTRRTEAELSAKGVEPRRAARLAVARLFGNAPGGYGSADYYYLIEQSGKWRSREDLAHAYLAQVKHAYTEGIEGESAPEAFEAAMRGTEIVVRNWTDPVRSPLTDKYAWYRGGSLALAVATITGKEPEYVLNDVRDGDRARTRSAEDAIAADFRVRFGNPKWIEGMMKEGYAGADQLSHLVNNAFGWSAMRTRAIRDDQWQVMKEVLVDDSFGLGLDEFFEKSNPFAMQSILETLLEAARKEFWNADRETLARLASKLTEHVERHGNSGGMRGAGNRDLEAFVQNVLGGAGPVAAEGGASAIVEGPVLAPVDEPGSEPKAPGATPNQQVSLVDDDAERWRDLLVFGSTFLIVVAGFIFGRRT